MKERMDDIHNSEKQMIYIVYIQNALVYNSVIGN